MGNYKLSEVNKKDIELETFVRFYYEFASRYFGNYNKNKKIKELSINAITNNIMSSARINPLLELVDNHAIELVLAANISTHLFRLYKLEDENNNLLALGRVHNEVDGKNTLLEIATLSKDKMIIVEFINELKELYPELDIVAPVNDAPFRRVLTAMGYVEDFDEYISEYATATIYTSRERKRVLQMK